MNKAAEPEPQPQGWLNRTVLGAGVTSFLADVGYEMAGAVLPGFLLVLHLPAAAFLGLIEGTADVLANAVKLGVGWLGDRLRRRKPLVVAGYAITGAANGLYALASGWPLVMMAKLLAWAGKGVRGPLRNAILAEAVAPADRGKAFGLHRAGDTAGAVVGPLLGAALLAWSAATPASDADPTAVYRLIFLLALIPGLGSALAFALMIRERSRVGGLGQPFWASLRDLPTGFKRQLVGIGIFGLGDFSDKLLILAAIQILAPETGLAAAASLGALLLAWRNGVQAAAAYPLGALGDRVGRRPVLIGGYLLGVVTMAGFAAAAGVRTDSRVVLFALLGLAGAYLAVEEALEGAVTADLVPNPAQRGTAYGLLAAVNGVGDFVASLGVGLLMQYVGLPAAFAAAGLVMLAGAAALKWVR